MQSLQKSVRIDGPPLAHQRAMREVAHVTKHTAILGHGFLGRIIAVIFGVGTNEGENAD